MPPVQSPARVYSVTELNELVHDLLESSLPELWVEGEISNCRPYPSGHTYFTLKDAGAEIKAVLFKGSAWNVKFKLMDGLKVLVRARASSYVKRGDLQLVVSLMEPRDKGGLQLAFEQLKAKLESEGLFSEERKKPLPAYPRVIGVVTSLQGAAIRDILSVLKRRWPVAEVLVSPVCVQGDGAKEQISESIADFNKHFPETDVLLVGRGGGSIEDLWAFNEEIVARAIAASKIPVVSCVGHETDYTIADFVADVRAPTPSAAAELAAPDLRAVLSEVSGLTADLTSCVESLIARLAERLGYLRRHPFLQSPHRMYEERARRVDEVAARLPDAMRGRLAHLEKDLALWTHKLDAISPLKVLGRGYAIAQKDGDVVRSPKQVKPGDALVVRVAEGNIHCEVTDDENR